MYKRQVLWVVQDVFQTVRHRAERDRNQHVRQQVVEIARQYQILNLALQFDALVVSGDEVKEKW